MHTLKSTPAVHTREGYACILFVPVHVQKTVCASVSHAPSMSQVSSCALHPWILNEASAVPSMRINRARERDAHTLALSPPQQSRYRQHTPSSPRQLSPYTHDHNDIEEDVGGPSLESEHPPSPVYRRTISQSPSRWISATQHATSPSKANTRKEHLSREKVEGERETEKHREVQTDKP